MIDTLIESVRAAVTDGATPEARTEGIAACRSILAALEPAPAASPTAQPEPAPQIPIAAIASALRGANPDQLLDLAIAKLRTLVPADAQAGAHRKLDIMMVGRKP
jgi:hypothetical protein